MSKSKKPTKGTAKHTASEQPGLSWERVRKVMGGRPRPMHILMVVLFLIVGLAVTTTVRSRVADPLAGLNEDQLVSILADLGQREEELLAERSQLEIALRDLSDAADAEEAARAASEQTSIRAEVAAGTVPVEGPGVTMRVTGATDAVPVSVFVTTLAELRNAGAEAIAINDVRLNGRAWFAMGEDGVVIASGTPLSPPYEWRAIGDGGTLSVALDIRGGAASQFRAYGAFVDTQVESSLTIDAVAPTFEPQWAESPEE